MDIPFDCQTCGACCVSPWDGRGYVRLDQADVERLGATALPVITQEQPGWDGEREQLVRLGAIQDRRQRWVCVALGGAAGEQCWCGVYELRPDACRRYEVGSSLCRSARQSLGLPA